MILRVRERTQTKQITILITQLGCGATRQIAIVICSFMRRLELHTGYLSKNTHLEVRLL